jgi:hypothetical protein
VRRLGFLFGLALLIALPAIWHSARAQSGAPSVPGVTILVTTPMPGPPWAYAERLLLRANGDGVAAHAARVMDERGEPLGAPAWGVGDGPDDHMEVIRHWPLAHALGGPDSILEPLQKAFEGYLAKYSAAKIPEVPMAKDGIFHNEFMTSFDWEHNSEGLGPFYYYGLSRPDDARYVARMRKWAGLYLNEDPAAQNYDARVRIVRSLFNGSRGPDLTPATVDDWDGPLPAGVSPDAGRRTRFRDPANQNIRGDHPLNMGILALVAHAYMLTGEAKYRDWVIEYADAWRERTERNGGNIPSNIGLDGTTGGEWGGKWYGGVFGWNSPDEGVRNYVFRGPPEGFNSALLVTGDRKYIDVMRRQMDNLFAAAKTENGRQLLPRFHGDQGWYGFDALGSGASGSLGNLVNVLVDIYAWSLSPADRDRVPTLPSDASYDTPPGTEWVNYLRTGDATYPMRALQQALDTLRRGAAPPAGRGAARGAAGARGTGGTATAPAAGAPAQGAASTTAPAAGATPARQAGAGPAGRAGAAGPAGRANAAGGAAPVGRGALVSTTALIHLTMGGPDPGGSSHGPLPLNVQVRHFDPVRRRAGLPEDVAALVDRISADRVSLTLVNLHPLQERTVTVQMGAYAEHRATSVTVGEATTPVNDSFFTVRLAPGAGATLAIGIERYVNRATLAFPWTRGARSATP